MAAKWTAANWAAARPVIVAPMAGGVSTPELVLAAVRAGALGFLAAGYKSAGAMRAQIDQLAAGTDKPFGVNVFVPGAPAPDPSALAGYLGTLSADAIRLGTTLSEAAWDDDGWEAKLADLVARPVPIVSFTFGCPPAEVVEALHGAGNGTSSGAGRRSGSDVWVTVTNPDEATRAAEAGADCLVVQGAEAGGHRGTFFNHEQSGQDARPGASDRTTGLLAAVRAVTDLPLVAAGGIMTAGGVAAARATGAVAVSCGTAFLRCPESGANPAHKAALADPLFERTAVTRAFSGRPARGLVNTFMREHADAPPAYPEINNATRPLRAAAAAAGDVHRMSLWAGEGYRQATTRPTAEVVELLCGGS
ncbi:MAG TPA: nitronate monooxygenase [Streptosporangiaceae bacterium]|nr:nitronate monooxygenase [Streptosporangiaceae bacterium]